MLVRSFQSNLLWRCRLCRAISPPGIAWQTYSFSGDHEGTSLSFNYCLLALLRLLNFQNLIALLFLLYMYVTKTFPTLNANLLCVNFVLCMELFVRGCDAPKQQGVVYSTSDTDTQRICIGCILQNPECQTHHWVWSPVLVYWIRILSFKAWGGCLRRGWEGGRRYWDGRKRQRGNEGC